MTDLAGWPGFDPWQREGFVSTPPHPGSSGDQRFFPQENL